MSHARVFWDRWVFDRRNVAISTRQSCPGWHSMRRMPTSVSVTKCPLTPSRLVLRHHLWRGIWKTKVKKSPLNSYQRGKNSNFKPNVKRKVPQTLTLMLKKVVYASWRLSKIEIACNYLHFRTLLHRTPGCRKLIDAHALTSWSHLGLFWWQQWNHNCQEKKRQKRLWNVRVKSQHLLMQRSDVLENWFR